MNAGLSNLDTLKRRLLAAALVPATDFDAAILALGLGVAGHFEKYCNRKFQREEDATFVCSADRDHVYVDRYPIEAFTQVELRTDLNVGWELQTGLILNMQETTGRFYWGAEISYHWAELKFTFTGGYWWRTTEPNDAGYSADTLPDGAQPIPADLVEAWLLQCEIVWKMRDKLGREITEGDTTKFVTNSLSVLDLAPLVKQMLNAHRRFQVV